MPEVEPPAREERPVVFEAPHTNGAASNGGGPTRPTHRLPRIRRGWIIGGAIAFVALWIFAIIWSVTVTPHSPERLDGAAASDVEAACARARTDLKALPALPNPAPGAARVDRVRSENVILNSMADRFDTVVPTDSTPASALKQWTSDWRRVIQARATYASDLETKKRARLVIPAVRGIQPVTDKMDDFVREQSARIDSCFTTTLQAEIVEGARHYDQTGS